MAYINVSKDWTFEQVIEWFQGMITIIIYWKDFHNANIQK